jgi:hypothetical protein
MHERECHWRVTDRFPDKSSECRGPAPALLSLAAKTPSPLKGQASANHSLWLLQCPKQLFRQNLGLVGKIGSPEKILRRKRIFPIREEALNGRERVLLILGQLLLVDLLDDLLDLLDSGGGFSL